MNSWRRSALERAGVAVLAAAVFAGCGGSDGRDELAQGRAAYAAGDLAKADRLFAESLRCDPQNVDALVESVRAKLRLGEIPAAAEAVARAVALAPDDADVVELQAQVAYHGKDYDAARRLYRKLATGAAYDAALRARGWAGLGVVEMDANEIENARLSFLRAVHLDRRNAAARYHLGHLYRYSFAYPDAALEQFEAYVRLDKVADERVQKVQREAIPAIREQLRQRMTEFPGVAKRDSAASAKALAEAEAAVKKGDAKAARAAYERAAAADVLSYPAALGLAKSWSKDPTAAGQRKAYACYRQACALRPDAVTTYLTAAELAVRQGQLATAVELYSRAMAADPKNITAIDGLIRTMRKAGGDLAKHAAAYQSYRQFVAPAKKR